MKMAPSRGCYLPDVSPHARMACVQIRRVSHSLHSVFGCLVLTSCCLIDPSFLVRVWPLHQLVRWSALRPQLRSLLLRCESRHVVGSRQKVLEYSFPDEKHPDVIRPFDDIKKNDERSIRSELSLMHKSAGLTLQHLGCCSLPHGMACLLQQGLLESCEHFWFVRQRTLFRGRPCRVAYNMFLFLRWIEVVLHADE
jgi:hypothetical protein